MRKQTMVVLAAVLALGLALAAPALAEDNAPQAQPYGMGPGMMGPGYGPGMMGPGYGRGMMGGGYGGWGQYPGYSGRGMMGPYYGGSGLTPEQMEDWQEKVAKFQMETLSLRQQIMSKQLELHTLWSQPKVDQDKVQKLSKEVSQLQAELYQKRDQFLLDCRQQFGGRGWACPGWGGQGWGGPGSGD